MGLYNFKPQFVPLVLDGTKTHTIRAPRKGSQDVPGNTMHLYTGLRTKKAKLLGRFECVKVEEIEIVRMAPNWISMTESDTSDDSRRGPDEPTPPMSEPNEPPVEDE